MAKNLFSLYLDPDLKSRASRKALQEGRSLAGLIEQAIKDYLEPLGARVTVETTILTKDGPQYGEFTSRIKSVDQDNKFLTLVDMDPVSIKSIHLL